MQTTIGTTHDKGAEGEAEGGAKGAAQNWKASLPGCSGPAHVLFVQPAGVRQMWHCSGTKVLTGRAGNALNDMPPIGDVWRVCQDVQLTE